MIDPSNLKTIYVDDQEIEIMVIKNVPEYDRNEYDLFDEKDFSKYVIDVKKEIRNSLEYREMVKYLRQNLDMNQCSFYKNVNNINTYHIKIELHHSPFTLEDITRIVISKRSSLGEPMSTSAVANEVMKLHYSMMIGLIPLSETVHELVHNGYFFVPLDKVYGNFRRFVNMYEPYMSAEQCDVYERIENLSKTYNELEQMDILKKKYIYLNVEGGWELPDMKDLLSKLYNKISDIKNQTEVVYQQNSKSDIKLIKPISFGK